MLADTYFKILLYFNFVNAGGAIEVIGTQAREIQVYSVPRKDLQATLAVAVQAGQVNWASVL